MCMPVCVSLCVMGLLSLIWTYTKKKIVHSDPYWTWKGPPQRSQKKETTESNSAAQTNRDGQAEGISYPSRFYKRGREAGPTHSGYLLGSIYRATHMPDRICWGRGRGKKDREKGICEFICFWTQRAQAVTVGVCCIEEKAPTPCWKCVMSSVSGAQTHTSCVNRMWITWEKSKSVTAF